jgi:hypothetical protein
MAAHRSFRNGDIVDIRSTGATLQPTAGCGDWNQCLSAQRAPATPCVDETS